MNLENVKNDLKKLKSEMTSQKILQFIAITVIALLIFQIGVFVGFRKAAFGGKLGDNYYKNFGEHKGGFGSEREFIKDGMPGGHGAIGKIVSVNFPTIVVAGPDNIEKIVLIQRNTDIRSFRDTASTTDLKVDEYVVVLGSPDDKGNIVAKLLRIIPPPPTFFEQRVGTTSLEINNYSR